MTNLFTDLRYKGTIPARDIAQDLQRRVAPGQRIDFDDEVLGEIATVPGYTAAEWILESIVGAAYEWSIRVDEFNRKTTFIHHAKPVGDSLRTYVSPDRRHLFRQRPDGLFEVLPQREEN
jgi:hypothetical protein